MIETCPAPGILLVAALALRTFLLGVFIIFAVTRYALRFELVAER